MNIFRTLRRCPALLIAVLLMPCCLRAQSTTTEELKQEADLYDARGFAQGKPMNTDGALMVSAANGNVSYSYPLSNFTQEGYSFKTSLNYCGSVAFTAFHKYHDNTDGSYWLAFHQNRGAWIMGFNGFAINVLHSVTTLKHEEDMGNDYDYKTTIVGDSNLVFLVDGYDFSNRMHVLYNEHDEDYIQILREDGSIMRLQHYTPGSEVELDDPERYSGFYYTNEANQRGFAKVTFDTISICYDRVRSWGGVSPSYWPRIVRYYPGDGLEYTFREWPFPFSETTYTDFSAANSITGGAVAGPSIFYLEKVRATNTAGSSGDLISFTHPYQNGDDYQAFGRSPITDFTGHHIQFGTALMSINALGRTTTVHYDKVVQSLAASNNTLIRRFPLGDRASANNPGDRRNSYLALVTRIDDEAGRQTHFDYESYKRNYTYYHWPNPDAEQTVQSVLLHNWRLSSVDEPINNYTIEYVGDELETITANGGVSNKAEAMNNIAKTVKKYQIDSSGYTAPSTLLSTDEYEYDYSSGSNSLVRASLKTTTDNINGTTKSFYSTYTPHWLYQIQPNGYPAMYTSTDTVAESAEGMTLITAYEYDTVAGKHFLIYPKNKTVSVRQENTTYIKSREEYAYEIDEVRSYGDTTINELIGSDIIKKTTAIKRPDDWNTTLLLKENEYIYLHLIDHMGDEDDTVMMLRQPTRMKKTATLPSSWTNRNAYEKSNSHAQKKGKEHLLADTSSYLPYFFSPPFAALETSSILYDTASHLLAGQLSTYEDWQYLRSEYHPAGRGMLLDVLQLGEGAARQFTRNIYSYWRGALPYESWSVAGSTSRFFYEGPSRGGLTMPTSSVMPDAIIAYSDGTRDSVKMGAKRWPGVLANYEGYRMKEQTQLRYNPSSGLLQTEKFTTCYDRGQFDQITGSMDANGFYSRYEYDALGRLRMAWIPNDFANNDDPLVRYYTLRDSAFLDASTVHWYEDRTLPEDFVQHETTFDSVLIAWLPVPMFATFSLSAIRSGGTNGSNGKHEGTPSGPSGKVSKGKSIENNEPYQYELYNKEMFMRFICPYSEAMQNATRIDRAYLKFFLTNTIGNCLQVELQFKHRTSEIGPPDSAVFWSKTYTLNCPATTITKHKTSSLRSAPQENTTNKHKGGERILSDDDEVSKTQVSEFVVDITAIKDSLMETFSDGTGKWAGELHMKTLGGSVEAMPSDSGDYSPRLSMQGEFLRKFNYGDYTLAYGIYDKRHRSFSSVSAKVDDAYQRVTAMSSDEEIVYDENLDTLGFAGSRYSNQKNFFGADYRTLRTDIRRVLTSGTQTDSVMTNYSGLGLNEGVTDQENYSSKTMYDGWGRPSMQIATIVSEYGVGDTTFFSYEVGDPSGSVSSNGMIDLSDQDFYGYYSVRRTSLADTSIRAEYYDAFDRLRREVTDEVRAGIPSALTANLQTRYEYDVQGRLTMVINPRRDTTRYWYDDFGRVRYKSEPDMGTISYNYDNAGNVRFMQTQEQADSNRMCFHEYDDLGRMTVIGEARFPGDSTEEARFWANQNDIDLHRLTDSADALVLHNGDTISLLTVNRTLWQTPESESPVFWSIDSLAESDCLPIANSLLGWESPPEEPYMKHPAQDWAENTTLSTISNFEDIRAHPENVRTVVQYDRLPASVGAVWAHFPDAEQWNALAPKDSIRNMLAHEVAVAYRQHGGEAFHYTVMSYDERGRVEAVIHYNENLGFDAVYYRYNSMNMVTEVRTVDPQRQHTSWYSYDHNGRVDSVWTKLGSVGTGLGISSPDFPSDLSRPSAPDITYGYTKRDQIDTMSYPAIDVKTGYRYDAQKRLTEIKANKDSSNLFWEIVRHNRVGNIYSQWATHGNDSTVKQNYSYDHAWRLTSWEIENGASEDYMYDQVGNRRQRDVSGGSSVYYSYSNLVGPNRLSSLSEASILQTYGYRADGAMKQRAHSLDYIFVQILLKVENFGYSYNGLLNKYTSVTSGGAAWDWRYRYSASGEREQKRTYTVPTVIVPVPGDGVKGWEYLLLGSDNKQHAVYKGIDASNQCGDVGRWVYFYPSEYLSYGAGGTANITTRPYDQYNGKKEFAIFDHLGSARATIDENGNVLNTQDYAPFGNVISGTEPPRKGFIDKEKDQESGDHNFGVRQFDGVRFTSIDPLFEKTPAWSPYVYSFNNPLTFKDPSGLFGDKPTPNADGGGAPPGDVPPMGGGNGGWLSAALMGAKAMVDACKERVVQMGNSIGRFINLGKEMTTDLMQTQAEVTEESPKLISQFSKSTIDEAVNYAMENKAIHIFDKAAHNLASLVTKLGGQESTIRTVLNAANGKLPESGIFKDVVVTVAGYDVYIRGSVVDGVPKLGTMFIK